MAQANYREAISWFRKSIEAASFMPSPHNNLALCLFAEGDPEEAVRAQRAGLDVSIMPNVFGQCNMVAFHLAMGREADAEDYLEKALDLEMVSVDACLKLCEALARFKRHQAILDKIEGASFPENAGLRFYAGVAAANLGLRGRARQELRRVSIGHPKAGTATLYLKWLNSAATPPTVHGDWPYLSSYEIYPRSVIELWAQRNEEQWKASRAAVEFCEALLNEGVEFTDALMGMLGSLTHPDAKALLWAIVKGTIGSDQLRMRALGRLREIGEVGRDEAVEMVVNGQRTKVATLGIRLNSEIQYGGRCDPSAEKIYVKALGMIQRGAGDWEQCRELFAQVMRAAPAFFPARMNYAVCLMYGGQPAEAERIFREIMASQPDYLFAPAILMQMMVREGRLEEARGLLQTISLPAEVHPDAMMAWLFAQLGLLKQEGRYDEMQTLLTMAESIAPDHPALRSAREDPVLREI